MTKFTINNMHIGDQFAQLRERIEKLEEKFLKYPRETLFPLDWEMLVHDRCPVCRCRLYQMRKRPIMYCKSKKHRTFMLSTDKMKEVLDRK